MNEIHAREEKSPQLPHFYQLLQQPQPPPALVNDLLKQIEYLPLSPTLSQHQQVLVSVLGEIVNAVFLTQSPTSSSGALNSPSLTSSLQHCMKLDKKLLYDRIDAIGNLVMVYMVWNFAAFEEMVQHIISRQVPSVKQLLMQYVQTLVTDRGVSLQSIQKKNRLIFVQNFREFYIQIKNLTIR